MILSTQEPAHIPRSVTSKRKAAIDLARFRKGDRKTCRKVRETKKEKRQRRAELQEQINHAAQRESQTLEIQAGSSFIVEDASQIDFNLHGFGFSAHDMAQFDIGALPDSSTAEDLQLELGNMSVGDGV